MKRILFTLFAVILLTTTQSNVFGQIIWSNCPDFDTDFDCMNIRTDFVLINIKVNLPDDMQNTTWKVQFSTSTNYEFIEYWNFRTVSEPNATHEYSYSLPINSNDNRYVFGTYLFSETGYLEATSQVMTFDLCEPYNSYRLLDNNQSALQIDKRTRNLNSEATSLLDELQTFDSNVFPSHFDDNLTLQYEVIQNEYTVFEIFDMSGILKYTTRFQNQNSGFHQKNIGNLNLEKGVYLGRIRANTYYNTFRLIKI